MFQMLHFHKILWNFETAVKRNEGYFFFSAQLDLPLSHNCFMKY